MRRLLIPFLILVALSRIASAADSPVPGYPAASALTGPELFYCVQGAADHKCTATQMGAFGNGVLNVRTQYGGVPDGSTNNNTAITNAFAAANIWSTIGGSPVVYFDCDTGQTTCVYNYNGSGLSPVKMLVPTTLLCAPGATLNYTGSAHAVELGPTTLTHDSQTAGQYRVQNCRFTGGANYTAGLYGNDFVSEILIADNYFVDFGNQTAFTIVLNGNNWRPIVSRNAWVDTDGFTKNVLDAHLGTNVDLLYTDNKWECTGASGVNPCSVSTVGVGLWVATGKIMHNQLTFHYPEIRIASAANPQLKIDQNWFEGNPSGLLPQISYGDPGTAGGHVNGPTITYNDVFTNVAANVDAFIGPETASSGSFSLDGPILIGNKIVTLNLSGTGLVVDANGGGANGVYSHNWWNNAPANQYTASFVSAFEVGHSNWGVFSFPGCCTNQANQLAAFDAAGVNLNSASYHHISQPLLCADTSGSTTAQACITAPEQAVAGAAFALQSGDMILYKTTTQNAGSLTVAVNGGAAKTVKKTSGTANLAGGEIKANFCCYPMTYDGTNLNVILGQ